MTADIDGSRLIDINLDDTPDRIDPVAAGVRTLDIVDIVSEENSQGETVHVVSLKVNQPEADDHERMTWDRFNFKYAPARVKFKQLCKAAGHTGTGQGVDVSELIGCTVKAIVKPRSYKDKDTGEIVDTTQVGKYLSEADSDDE